MAWEGTDGEDEEGERPPAHDPKVFERHVAEILGSDLAAHWGQAGSLPRYILIDGGQCPEGWIDRWCHEQGQDAEPLFLRTPESAWHPQGQHLIEIPGTAMGETHPLITSLAQGPCVWQALTVTASPLPVMKLHAHLRGFLGGVLEDGTEALLRWFDARVGMALLDTLPESTRTTFMQPFAFWKSWDWHYQPVAIEGPKRPSLPEAPPALVPIDEKTLKTLSALNVVQSLIAHLEDEPPLDPDIAPLSMSPALKHYIAARELEAAQALGLATRFGDQLSVLWFALHVHPDVWRHAHMQEEGKRRFAKTGTMRWLLLEHRLRAQGEQALARLGAEFLAEMKAGRENGQTTALSKSEDLIKVGRNRHG
jgi:hypothetical protein